jgi:isopentenyl diphosphate isomerase/L-lactate dehydrogenase-like FMN-dependent dehydrogenase
MLLGRKSSPESKLRLRVLVDVSQRNLQTTILGQPIEFPALSGCNCLADIDRDLCSKL